MAALLSTGTALLAAVFYALAFGLLAGGIYVARRTTTAYLWAHLLAEARLSGGQPSKGGVWLGNLALPVIFVLAGAWLGGA